MHTGFNLNRDHRFTFLKYKINLGGLARRPIIKGISIGMESLSDIIFS